MEQQPPSRIEELELLVSNLRLDLQVAHDALHKSHQRLEEAEWLMKGTSDDSEDAEWWARRDAWIKGGK